ncbi:4Fe-4S dicluster domain-containing protein [Desulfacinum hydrothermale DSM 13146]|uniref:4Fe-4S dicluster domain-containing protein n=1 Tax=Desulfacinum hydrothermale DSM 13146 TaxID=1121390 RepID=A0A1W1X4I6_9BACT|nr:4Fe-4S binding protein [Desulfacinum hydrothermale]SMC18874.1 4Fe-4S dicluster domain-containing protein [Desulfacinum hydrothermale DSM 13146]
MKDIVRTWLESGRIDLFLGYRLVDGHPIPHCFSKERLEEVEQLTESLARYPLEKIAHQMLQKDPAVRIGLMARDCTQRSVRVLAAWNQIDMDRIRVLTMSCCPSDAKDKAFCSYLQEPETGPVRKSNGMPSTGDPDDCRVLPAEERLRRWLYEFQKCIKCYGCRDICPVCFCKDCGLEHEDLMDKGVVPPEVPLFHLIRAVHMAGRCVDCGLCEEACPVGIPLRLLYRKVNGIVTDRFGYRVGQTKDQSPFNVLGEFSPLELSSLDD